MEKTKKTNLIFAGILATTMAFAGLGLGLVATTRVQSVSADTLPTLTYTLSDEGVFTWDPITNEASYPDADEDGLPDVWYYLDILDADGVNVAGTMKYPDAKVDGVFTYDLKSDLISAHKKSGTYSYELYALDYEDASGNFLTEKSTGTYAYVSTQTPFATPTNLRWEGTVAMWDAGEALSDNYCHYEVNLYELETDEHLGLPYNAYGANTQADWATHIEEGKEYYFTVQVKISYGKYTDRAYSAVASSKPEPAVEPAKAGLSAGAIAGITIASLVVASVGVFALVWFGLKKKTWAQFVALFKRK